MDPQQINGFLLHRREYRETSYLTDFFTAELGKISAVVKGVRGSKGDKKVYCNHFSPCCLMSPVSMNCETCINLNQVHQCTV
ncbi:recombination protein O N-terminal domain-containing protein [Paraglaciecola aquimarina]|uniref:Recombination protein O N-terminal domain-containing protein n=1 Tax=Paraglaciecola aquimarina TaxID=1235557 RepID=A0ABU3SW05_9ALTE|nr:recombination protein O N-terminal domain-containing protein [Paraglaciecola aquimarina]MDU0354167.1 recombination protein O N-terminal domain-containing protein [Paraglaciecola aquimarina]